MINYDDMRFLVVEDFDQMLKSVRQMLEGLGARHIYLARDGERALELLASWPMDVVLCDYNLGESKDGQQVLEEARHLGLLAPGAAFIMITAETSTEMVLGAVEHRPDDYLAKPFSRNSLRARLERVLRRKAAFAPVDSAAAAGHLDQALGACERQLAAHPRYRMDLLRRQGELLVEAGRWAEAEALYDRVLGEREQLHWAAMGKGLCRLELGDAHGAEAVFTQLVNRNRLGLDAYDGLARARRALGQGRAAQQVLQEAVQLSAKSLPRLRALGELARENADLEAAAVAFRQVVKAGRYSARKDPADYLNLAQVLEALGEAEGARLAREEGRAAFPGHPGLAPVAAAAPASGDLAAPREAAGGFVVGGVEAALAEARALFEEGRDREALEALEHLVRNHHDDDEVAGRVQALCDEAGFADEGTHLVESTRERLVRLNNEGVELARSGRLDEAIALFRDAAAGLPANRVINLNAAQVMVRYLETRGVDDALRHETAQYLDRVGRIDPDSDKYQAIRQRFDALLAPPS